MMDRIGELRGGKAGAFRSGQVVIHDHVPTDEEGERDHDDDGDEHGGAASG
jgi:hypothetical protein